MSAGTLSIDPPPDPSQRAKNFWENFDKLGTDTLNKAKSTFRLNTTINAIAVAIGVALFTTSIIQSWIQQTNPSTAVFAVVGAADFVALFLVGPQRGVETALANLNQVQMAYQTFRFEFEALIFYDDDRSKTHERTIDEIATMNREAEKVMTTAMEAIAKYIVRNPEKQEAG